ncbi:hypothetical protein ACHQM5_013313 [Ranunculus cassubicifolius]
MVVDFADRVVGCSISPSNSNSFFLNQPSPRVLIDTYSMKDFKIYSDLEKVKISDEDAVRIAAKPPPLRTPFAKSMDNESTI